MKEGGTNHGLLFGEIKRKTPLSTLRSAERASGVSHTHAHAPGPAPRGATMRFG